MGLNLSGLKKHQADLESRSGGNKYFTQKNIGEETDIRILPPTPAMNGLYFIERTVFWINKKPYVSPATFGEPCSMERQLEVLKDEAKSDPDLQQLIDSDKFQKKTDFMMAILHLDCEFGNSNEPTSVKVVDDKAQIFTCGPQLMKAMNRLATSRGFQNGTEDGFTDRVKGYGMILSKKGSGLDTEYGALPWSVQYEMPEKYYQDVPDVIKETRSGIYPEDYLLGVMDNYFYGDAMPEKPKTKQEEEKPKKKRPRPVDKTGEITEKPTKTRRSTNVETTEEKPAKRRVSKKAEPETEQEEPTTAKRTPAKTGNRNLMKDLNNM